MSLLQKQLEALNAVIVKQRSGRYHIRLQNGNNPYPETYEAYTKWGARRTAERLLRRERKYITSQTEWRVDG